MAFYTVGGNTPTDGGAVFVADNATLAGAVRLEEGSSVWYGAVLRADTGRIVVGAGSNVQDNAVLHTEAGHPLTIGRDVTVGHSAVVHGCTVEDGALIGMHATVLNDAVVGAGSIVAAGALVTEGFVVPPRSVVMGVPAKVRGDIRPEQLETNLANTTGYVDCARAHAAAPLLNPETLEK